MGAADDEMIARPLEGTDFVGEMPDAVYHSDPCTTLSLSASIAKVMVMKSPAHAWEAHPRLGGAPFRPSNAADYGTFTHSGLLDTHDRHFSVLPEEFKDFRKQAARELRDAAIAAGLSPLTATKRDDMNRHVERLKQRFKAKGIVIEGEAEQVLIWQERASSGRLIQCRAKVDLWDEPAVRDLKSCASAKPKDITRDIFKYGYHIQAAAYESAIAHVYPELTGRITYDWIFYEKAEPFAVTVCEPDALTWQLGRAYWAHAVDLWDQCMHSGVWPDYADKTLRITPPPHVLAEFEELIAREDEAA